MTLEKQIIITIGREYGSGGHEIGRKLAERLHMGFYDRNILDEIAYGKNVDAEKLAKYDEVPKTMFLSKTVRGFSNSPEENIAQMQFEYIREKAASGESFVIVGRCADYILRESEALLSVFITGDYESKLERVMERRNFSAKQAAVTIDRHDKNRKAYHNHYCTTKWGDSRNYDMCINSNILGIDGTVDLLENFVKNWKR